ncbi:MAG TPA: hypothetical protein VEK57_07055 [Thermoanaerobaculia bacterium]|nr:hypothetical protein [Thermoanaerobaculia bacterium]
MCRLLLTLLLLIPTFAFAQPGQPRRVGADWTPASEKGCIGGSGCSERRLRVALQDRPVVAVRFHAHDQVGNKADGALRVKIDGNTVNGYIDIPRKGEVFTVDVDELRGRYLVLEAVNNDEVEISDIAVLYAPRDRDTIRRVPRDPYDDRPGRGGSGSGWRGYPRAATCIGGDECRKNGKRITIALEEAPVLGVRFHAHDSVGQRADGKLTVRIDDTTVGSYIDIQRAGKRHELDVDNVFGSKLVFEAASDDEIDIKDIEVLYGRGRRGGGRGPGSGGRREITDEGACIGGSECGGKRARIRIALRGRPVDQIRFYARDDIGSRAGGELRIRIDDEILQYGLDIPREGKTFTIDGGGTAGDYLYIEPAKDDEVMVKDVRVRLGEDDDE